MAEVNDYAQRKGPGAAASDGTEEVSLVRLGAAILRQRRLLLWMALGLPVLLIAWSLIIRRTFTATGSFLPQSADQSASPLAGLAAQFGVALPATDPSQSPDFYASLLKSREIMEPAVDSRYRLSDADTARSKLSEGTLMDLLQIDDPTSAPAREEAIRRLGRLTVVTTDHQTNLVQVTATTRWGSLSEQIVRRMLVLVDSFNLTTRQVRARAERQFVEDRMEKAQEELRAAEDRLQFFLQQNRDYHSSPRLTFDQDRLQREVTLRQSVVTSLIQAYETARITEVRNTPLITWVERPEVPAEPDRRYLALKAIVGFILGASLGMVIAVVREILAASRRSAPADLAEFDAVRMETVRETRRLLGRVRSLLPRARAGDGSPPGP